MINENGVVLKQFSDDTYDAFGEAAASVFEETRQHSALAAEVNDHYQATLREVGGWRKIAEVAFANQRNRVLGI
jgi:TRAP-type mannitol/chloroaromatic compound transport system substrate-binding protein